MSDYRYSYDYDEEEIAERKEMQKKPYLMYDEPKKGYGDTWEEFFETKEEALDAAEWKWHRFSKFEKKERKLTVARVDILSTEDDPENLLYDGFAEIYKEYE